MVVRYPSTFEAYRYIVNGESVIVKNHRMFNYNRMPVGITRPGVITMGILIGAAATFILTDLIRVSLLNDTPVTFNRDYFKKMRARRIRNRENPIKSHKIGSPVQGETYI